MIYGSSSDPVIIKKIALRIWTLRDEIEAAIKEKIQNENEEGKQAVGEVSSVYGNLGKSAAKVKAADAAEESSADQNAEKDNDSEKMSISLAHPQLAPEGLCHAKTILSEINLGEMFFFCDRPFLEGQSIVIEFLVPRLFILNADVVYCRPHNMKSRIVSDQKIPFRTKVKFTFLKQGERTILREFLKSIEIESANAAKARVLEEVEAEVGEETAEAPAAAEGELPNLTEAES